LERNKTGDRGGIRLNKAREKENPENFHIKDYFFFEFSRSFSKGIPNAVPFGEALLCGREGQLIN
jgi:hypothetical protein